MTDRFYDNTRVSAMKRCPRYYYYRHMRDWTPEVTGPALVFGSSWHESMDVVWRMMGEEKNSDTIEVATEAIKAFNAKWVEEGMLSIEELGPDDMAKLKMRHPGTAMEMIYNYCDTRKAFLNDPELEIVAIEQPFAVPLDPSDPDLFYVGRLDKVFRKRGKLFIGEHKTSSLYSKSSGFRSTWIDSFSPNSQVDGYLFAARILYGECEALWIDGALVHANIHDVFKFIPVDRADQQLDAWLWETRYWIDMIESNKSAMFDLLSSHADESGNPTDLGALPYMPVFPKNCNSCMDFAGCSYLDLCKMWPNPVERDLPLGYKQEHWSPFEVLELEKIGLKNPS
jgi:hypothetical protein